MGQTSGSWRMGEQLWMKGPGNAGTPIPNTEVFGKAQALPLQGRPSSHKHLRIFAMFPPPEQTGEGVCRQGETWIGVGKAKDSQALSVVTRLCLSLVTTLRKSVFLTLREERRICELPTQEWT